MHFMIFERKGEAMKPRLIVGPDNVERVPDGVQFFSLEQAAAASDRTAEELAADWMDDFADFAPNQAADAVIAATPTDSPAMSAVQVVIDRRLQLLHRTIYPHLTDEHFAAFVEICRERSLSPWSRHLWPEVRDGKFSIITTIDAFRLIADRTGRYAPGETIYINSDGVERKYWSGKEPPIAVLVSVMRDGKACWADASYESYVQTVLVNGRSVPSEFWLKMPDVKLSICGEARAIRKAFPHELAGLYTREEMTQRDNTPAPRQQRPGDIPDALVTDETPESFNRFRLQVIDLVGSKRADNLIDHFRAVLGWRHHHESPVFYATVLAELERNPAAYGVEQLAA